MQPYTRIRIPFISKHLNIPENDVEQLLVSLILDKRIRGHIDQVQTLSFSTYDKPCYLSSSQAHHISPHLVVRTLIYTLLLLDLRCQSVVVTCIINGCLPLHMKPLTNGQSSSMHYMEQLSTSCKRSLVPFCHCPFPQPSSCLACKRCTYVYSCCTIS